MSDFIKTGVRILRLITLNDEIDSSDVILTMVIN